MEVPGGKCGDPVKRQGYGEKRDVGEQPGAREPQGYLAGVGAGRAASKSLRGHEGRGMAAQAVIRKMN